MSAINNKIGDKKTEKYKSLILEYLKTHPNSKTQDISLHICLKISRTKDYLAELSESGKIIAHGANKNRTYEIKKESPL